MAVDNRVEANEQSPERDELDDLDVEEQRAEDVRGGARGRKRAKPGL
jgi:hypothetical protein